MSYLELVQALRDEVAAEIRRIEEQAAEGARRLLDEARQQAESERARAIAEAQQAAQVGHRRALADATAEHAQAELLDRERLVANLRGQVAARLPALRVADRMLEELRSEIPAGPIEVHVAAADARLAVPPAARVVVDDAVVAGVIVCAGPVILDNSLPSRLERLWPHIAPQVAALLFGESHGAL